MSPSMRLCAVLICFVLATTGCGSGDGFTHDGTAGVYIYADVSGSQVSDDLDRLARGDGHDINDVGYRRGVVGIARVQDPGPGLGGRIHLAVNSSSELVTALTAEAEALDYQVVQVSDGQQWPDCVGEQDCQRAEFGASDR